MASEKIDYASDTWMDGYQTAKAEHALWCDRLTPHEADSWTDRHYRGIMLTLMLVELALLAWIAWRA